MYVDEFMSAARCTQQLLGKDLLAPQHFFKKK